MSFKASKVDRCRLNDSDHLKKIRSTTWEVHADWKRIAEELGLPTREINAIEVDGHDVGGKYAAVLKKWIQSFHDPQISQLIEVFESNIMGRTDLAIKLAALKLT